MKITLVAAASENNVIGIANGLPWHLPNDLKFFKQYTLGKVIVMGRKTFESIGMKALPNRVNVVLTRDMQAEFPGAVVFSSLEEVLEKYRDQEEICVVGGQQIFERALPLATDIRLTRVHVVLEGDTFFPEFSEDAWKELSCEPHPADERHAYAYDFLHYLRH